MSVSAFAAAPLSDRRVQLWMNTPEYIYTAFQTSTSPGAPWSGWQTFPGPVFGVPGINLVTRLAAAPLSDGRLQLWASSLAGLFTQWKMGTDPNSGWSDWQVFPGPAFAAITAAPLSDGRLQLWAAAFGEEVLTQWKTGTDPNSAWSGWQAFPAPGPVQQIAVAPLPDGQLQLWAITTDNKLFSEWKTAKDPNSAWSGWQAFPAPGPVQQIAVAPLPDGRLQLWATTTDNKLFSEWKTNTSPGAPWSGWQDFFRAEYSWLNLGHGESSGGANKCDYTLNLTIKNDGTCRFWGSYTNRGDVPLATAPSQTFGVSIVVVDANRQSYSFSAGGKVPSAPQAGSTFSWDKTEKSQAIANNWDAIVLRSFATYGYHNDVSLSDILGEIENTVNQVVSTVKEVAGAVESVIQIAEAVGV